MKRITRYWLLLVLLLPAAARADTAADVAVVAPYIDQQTLVVVAIDTSAMDSDAATQWLQATIKASVEPGKETPASAMDSAANAGKWLTRFRAAGGGMVYLVGTSGATLYDAWFLMAPIPAGSDSKTLQAVFGDLLASIKTEVINQNVFLAYPRVLEKLRQFKPVARPELSQALSGGGDSPIRAAIIPSADVRKVFEALSPTLPPEMGGGPVTTITHGLRIAWVSATAAPHTSLKLEIQSQDADSATALGNLIRSSLRTLADNPSPGAPALLKTVAAQIEPNVAGDHLTISLNTEKANQFASLMASGILRARKQDTAIADMMNMRQILIACYKYANAHQDQWPDSLEQLVKDQVMPASLLTSPRDPARKPAYVYVKPALPAGKVPPDNVILYDAYDTWDEDGIGVGFTDGHIEMYCSPDAEARFKKILEVSKQPAAK